MRLVAAFFWPVYWYCPWNNRTRKVLLLSLVWWLSFYVLLLPLAVSKLKATTSNWKSVFITIVSSWKFNYMSSGNYAIFSRDIDMVCEFIELRASPEPIRRAGHSYRLACQPPRAFDFFFKIQGPLLKLPKPNLYRHSVSQYERNFKQFGVAMNKNSQIKICSILNQIRVPRVRNYPV